MAAKRILLGVFWAVVVGVPAFAQAPPVATDPASKMPDPPSLSSPGSGLPYMPSPMGHPGSTAVLTAPPGSPVAVGALPPGSVATPWCGGAPVGACCGPMGANGPVTYELYVRTGPNLIVGGSPNFSSALKTGWVVAGGGRTLLYDSTGDAAWALDLGVGYNYTRGDSNRVIDVFSPRETDPNTGLLAGPDQIHPFRVRSLHRSTFNYALGRDWFLNGPGFLGAEHTSNTRIGFDVGGRWGYSHVDLVPVENPRGYLRRSGTTHGFYLGTNYTWEQPMGAWILVIGGRAEWDITFSNLVAPQNGNLQDVNLLLTFGVRF